MTLVRFSKIPVDAHIGVRAAERADNKDARDEERKELVREAGRVDQDPIEIQESREEHVKGNPEPDPRIQC